MKLGVQIYGCMDIFRKNPDDFFRGLANMGYTQIEPCVAFGITKEEIESSGVKPIWLKDEVKTFKAMLEGYGLALTSVHIFGNPLEHIDEINNMIQENNIEQIVLNCPRELSQNACIAFADMCCKVATQIESTGAKLWLHNSFAEIRERVDGKSAYEFILDRCAGAVLAQVDVGWVLYGGENPLELMERIRPLIASIHYKDLKLDYKNLPPEKAHAALGTGALDTKAIIEFSRGMNITQLIDQDNSDGDFLEDLRISADEIKANL